MSYRIPERREWLSFFSLVAQLSGGLLLFCAGIAKVWSIGPAYLFGSVVLSRELHVAVGLFEIVLGVMAFAFKEWKLVRVLMLATFFSFLTVLGLKYLNGATHCNCIPGVASPLLLMVLVDSVIFTGIAVSFILMPDWGRYNVRPLRGVYIALGISAFVLCSRYSSADQAFRALAGLAITVDQSHKAGVTERDLISFPFVVSNHGDAARKILGARSSCGCTALEGLPRTIPAKGSFAAKMTVGKPDDLSQGAREFISHLFCDDGTPVTIQATVVFAKPD